MFFEWLGFYVSISVLLAVEVGESTTGNSAVILMRAECRIVKSLFCVFFFMFFLLGVSKFFCSRVRLPSTFEQVTPKDSRSRSETLFGAAPKCKWANVE